MIQFFIIFFSFYLLILLQTSFLFNASVLGITLNLPLLLVVAINFFEKQKEKIGIFSAIICGFLFDFFSNGFWGINFLGFYVVLLLFLAVFIKFFIKRYI